ncbi:hypothetical protein B0H14DRAFT_3530000 [Mycena olivaceomarginata]|nr:hypothetical protein B0H14DRAFT_3530000 [Mycena olivaceomarginata]
MSSAQLLLPSWQTYHSPPSAASCPRPACYMRHRLVLLHLDTAIRVLVSIFAPVFSCARAAHAHAEVAIHRQVHIPIQLAMRLSAPLSTNRWPGRGSRDGWIGLGTLVTGPLALQKPPAASPLTSARLSRHA